MAMRGNVSSFGLVVCAVVFLVSTLVGYFLFSVAYYYSDNVGRSVGAVHGWAGEEGTLTVTGKVRRSGGRTSGWRCVGTFAPADGGPVQTDVSVHVSGDCKPGDTEDARFVVGRDSWFHSEGDAAFGESAGAGFLIVGLVFIDLFCGIVGLACVIFAWASGRELFKNLWRLAVTGRRPSP